MSRLAVPDHGDVPEGSREIAGRVCGRLSVVPNVYRLIGMRDAGFNEAEIIAV